jgi:hypothetical protein
VSAGRLALSAAVAAIALPASTAQAQRCALPSGARVVHGPVVRSGAGFYFCAGRTRQLVPLWLPRHVEELGRVIVRGHFVAYAYYRDVGCDNATVGVRSQNWWTGATGYRIPSYGPCYDVYAWHVRALALRSTTGAVAAIRRKEDFEDGFNEDTVIKADGPRAVVLDQEDVLGGDERLNPERIVGGLRYRQGRVYWRRASGAVRSARLGG